MNRLSDSENAVVKSLLDVIYGDIETAQSNDRLENEPQKMDEDKDEMWDIVNRKLDEIYGNEKKEHALNENNKINGCHEENLNRNDTRRKSKKSFVKMVRYWTKWEHSNQKDNEMNDRIECEVPLMNGHEEYDASKEDQLHNISRKRINRYLTYGKYLSDEALNVLCEMKATKRDFERVQKIKKECIQQCRNEEMKENEIMNIVSEKMIQLVCRLGMNDDKM